MNSLAIALRDGHTSLCPGDVVAGDASWRFDAAPEAVELRLFWYTQGKGTQDVTVVDTARFDNPGAQGSRAFAFTLPEGPYSFSGKLISLIWALELVSVGANDTTRQEVIVSPTLQEILLHNAPAGADGP